MRYIMLFLLLVSCVSALELSEIMYNPIDGNEWVELYTSQDLNLSGYELTDNMNSDQIVCCGSACDMIVPKDNYLLIFDQDTSANYSGYRFCVDDSSIGNGLGNSADAIIITKDNNILINFSYSLAVQKGKTLSYVNGSWAETDASMGSGFFSQSGANETEKETVDECQTEPIACDYSNLTSAIEGLESKNKELNKTIALVSSKKEACEMENGVLSDEIEELNQKIHNLTLFISSLRGCEHNLPPCPWDYDCVSNNCQLKKGCEYNNPDCQEGFICRDNSCIMPKKISFRTNILDERYYDPLGEIALQSDGILGLECFRFDTFKWFYYSRYPQLLAKTPKGHEVHKLPDGRIIINDHLRNPIYKSSNGCSISLSEHEDNKQGEIEI